MHSTINHILQYYKQGIIIFPKFWFMLYHGILNHVRKFQSVFRQIFTLSIWPHICVTLFERRTMEIVSTCPNFPLHIKPVQIMPKVWRELEDNITFYEYDLLLTICGKRIMQNLKLKSQTDFMFYDTYYSKCWYLWVGYEIQWNIFSLFTPDLSRTKFEPYIIILYKIYLLHLFQKKFELMWGGTTKQSTLSFNIRFWLFLIVRTP